MSVSGLLRFQRLVASVAAEPEAWLLTPAPPLRLGQSLPSLALHLPFRGMGTEAAPQRAGVQARLCSLACVKSS